MSRQNPLLVVFADCLGHDEAQTCPFISQIYGGKVKSGIPRVTPQVVTSALTGYYPPDHGILSPVRLKKPVIQSPLKRTLIEDISDECKTLNFEMPITMNLSGKYLTNVGGGIAGNQGQRPSELHLPGPPGAIFKEDREKYLQSTVDYVSSVFCTIRNLMRGGHFEATFLSIRDIDSIAWYSPVVIKDDEGHIDIVQLHDLWNKVDGEIYVTDEGEEIKKVDGYRLFHNGVWKRFNRIIRHQYKGQMVKVNTKKAVVDVTPNHSIIFSKSSKNKEAKDISVGDKISVANTDDLGTASYAGGTRFFIGDEDLAWLYGFFAGDGAIRWQRRKNKDYEISFVNTDLSLLEEVERIFARFFSYHMYQSRQQYDHNHEPIIYDKSINHKHIYYHFRSNFYTDNGEKKVPQFMFNAPRNIQKAFLEGYSDSDGTKDENGKIKSMTTNSQTLAMGLLWIYHSVDDRSYNLYIREDKPNITTIAFNNAEYEYRNENEVKKTINMDYEGYVYDIEVDDEPHHFYTGVGLIKVHNSYGHFLYKDERARLIQHVDGELAETAMMGSDLNLLAFSDHGITDKRKTFYLNKWLQDQGYLDLNIWWPGIERERAKQEDPMEMLSVHSQYVHIKDNSYFVSTDAFDSGIKILRDDAPVEKLRQELMETGFYNGIYTPEELWGEGENREEIDIDLVCDRADGIMVSGNIWPIETTVDANIYAQDYLRSGVHSRYGFWGSNDTELQVGDYWPVEFYHIMKKFLGLNNNSKEEEQGDKQARLPNDMEPGIAERLADIGYV